MTLRIISDSEAGLICEASGALLPEIGRVLVLCDGKAHWLFKIPRDLEAARLMMRGEAVACSWALLPYRARN